MFWIVHHNQYGRDADNIETVSHDEVLEAAKKAESKVRKLIKELIVNY
jgi:purine-nucleoside phosphorylase